MVHKHKNLTFNISHIDPRFVDHLGETVLHLSGEQMAEMIEWNCTFWEYLDFYDYEHYVEDIDQDNAQEKLIQFFKENCEDTFEVCNADCIIAVYEYCLTEDNEYEFDIDTEHLSWVLHDLLHAEHDAAGCTIYVEAEVEKQRIYDSMNQVRELYPDYMPSLDFLEDLERSYRLRFKKHIDLVDQFLPY